MTTKAMRVALRVDASAAMGLGHLQRCLALAEALRTLDVKTVFVTRDLGLDSTARIAAAGFAAHVLPTPPVDAIRIPTGSQVPHAAWAGVPWLQDAEETAAVLQQSAEWMPDWVMIDHYAFDDRWHRAVSAALGSRLAAIDDLADRQMKADLLIDHNLAEPDHRTKYRGRIGAGTVLLGGPRYALLGPHYADGPRCNVRDPVHSIGIFLGGTDPAGLSELVLRACREDAGFIGPIELVTTRANPRHAVLHAMAELWPHTKVTLDLPDLSRFFAEHDLHVGAGGGATWERCCVGAPALVIVAAANQLAVAPQLERLGAVAALPACAPQTARAIGDALRLLLDDAPRRRALGKRAMSLVDGLGARRVALHMATGTLRVRLARATDSGIMHRWRNDARTRSVSRCGEVIPLAEHEQWLARTLADARRLLMVGEVGSIAIGVIRFDRLDDENAEVSLYLDPALQGLGLGTALLRAGETATCAWARTGLRFVATTLDGNAGSRRLFESSGYRFFGQRAEKPAHTATL